MLPRILSYLICLSGFLFAMPLLVLISLALVTPLTPWGTGYLIGSAIVVLGMIMAPVWRKYSFAAILGGLGIILLIACLRILLARNEDATAHLRMILLPQGKGTRSRWINYVIDEQDSVVIGEAVLHRLGGVWPHEQQGIVPSLYAGYSELRAIQRIIPSPFVGTYLNLENQAAFDTIVIEPEAGPARVGIVFLHGYMGNVALQCWRIAQAVQKLGAVTTCPSTDWTGEWWKPQGQVMVRATFHYLHQRGIQTIYLGGFSNGSISASRLAPGLANEDDSLKGLFLIAGATNAVDIRNTDLPVLVIQGSEDQRIPVTDARQFIGEVGDLGTYAEIESDHFLIMKEPAQVQEAITGWLEKQSPATSLHLQDRRSFARRAKVPGYQTSQPFLLCPSMGRYIERPARYSDSGQAPGL